MPIVVFSLLVVFGELSLATAATSPGPLGARVVPVEEFKLPAGVAKVSAGYNARSRCTPGLTVAAFLCAVAALGDAAETNRARGDARTRWAMQLRPPLLDCAHSQCTHSGAQCVQRA